MNKIMKKIIRFLLILCFFNIGFSQNKNALNKTPKEQVYINYNANYFLSGEKLFYNIYNINTSSKKLSNISKIAYVELIDITRKEIFKHKIKLENGVGYGDFFIPPNIKTGAYKIIGYTKWIKNFGLEEVFIGDIFIINPFLDNSSLLVDSFLDKKDKEILTNKIKNISIQTDKGVYKNREKVKVSIQAKQDALSFGNYSISIRKKDSLNSIYENSFFNKELGGIHNKIQKNKIEYTPEFRGEVIEGMVINSKTNKPVFNCLVSFSIPDKDYVFKIVQTNNNGEFFIPLSENYNKSEAILRIADKQDDNYRLILKQEKPLDYSSLNFKEFKIPKKYLDFLTERSTDTQINNAYNYLKQDSLLARKLPERFFSLTDERTLIYNLDDYTRFKNLKETLTEFIAGAYHYRKKGKYYLGILGVDFIVKDNHPLVLVDGVRILDIDKIINLNAKKIKRIIIRKDNYSYGTELFNGIIAIETYKGEYVPLVFEKHSKKITLFNPLNLKTYYQPNYSKNDQKRIPDFRQQLFWKPNFKLDKKTKEINFYTSDKKGIFEITVEGITNSGTFVSSKKEFTVE